MSSTIGCRKLADPNDVVSVVHSTLHYFFDAVMPVLQVRLSLVADVKSVPFITRGIQGLLQLV